MTEPIPLSIGAAYIRVSTDDQTELSPTPAADDPDAAKKDGITIPPEFIFMEDHGVSGRRADNRPEFQRMISVARQAPSPFQYLYLWKFSRFARNQEESAFYKGSSGRNAAWPSRAYPSPSWTACSAAWWR